MKKILKLFILFIILLFNYNISYSKNQINRILFLKNKDYIRFVFYSKNKPNYLLKNNKNTIEIDFLNDEIGNNVVNNFKRKNNNVKIEVKNFKTYSVFRYFKNNNGKVLKNIFISPDKNVKFYRIIIDVETKKVNVKKSIKKNAILDNKKKLSEKVNNEDYSFEKLEDLIENKVDVVENNDEKLDSLLNEILEFRLLKDEIIKDKIVPENIEISNFIDHIDDEKYENINKYDIDNYRNNIFVENKDNEMLNTVRRNTFKDYKSKKYYIVVIDAGHGGKDPGTIGVRKSKEKNINLIYAQSLKKALEKYRKIKVVLTRNDDTFFELSERIKIARQNYADLFISLHSDFSGNKKTRGLTVYTLSKTASDKRTAQLAVKENRNNLLVGVDLINEYQDTVNTLIDLSRVDILGESRIFANQLVDGFHNDNLRVTELPHRSANFGVLLAPDFPSVLIELGFLSNVKDEKMLQSYSYRKDVCKSIAKTISKYFKL